MPTNSTQSLLLIEDHNDIAETVTAYLEGRGYDVDYAADGVTGLHLAVSHTYDAIILDLVLPGMDGLELCQKLRNEARRDTPVIMLTVRDTLDDKITGLETGADDYLIKPFAIRELEARVRSLIRRHKGETAKEILIYTDQGSVEISIEQNKVVVKDSGKGIQQKHVDDIFKPYFRGDNTMANGHGVGLTIVKRLSDQFPLADTHRQQTRCRHRYRRAISRVRIKLDRISCHQQNLSRNIQFISILL